MSLFKPPVVRRGDIVDFWADGETTGEARSALVIRVGEHTLALSCFELDDNALTPADGVFHAADPRLASPEIRQSGCWKHNVQHEELELMKEALGKLTRPK